MSESNRDEQLEVLRAIWGEMKTLNSRINTTGEELRSEFRDGLVELRGESRETREYLGARIDATNERLDRLNEEVREGFAQTRLDRRRLNRLEERVDVLERGRK